MADEVEHREHRLAVGLAESSPELLKEDGGALGGAEHEDNIDGRDVDTLVEQIDREQHLHLAVTKVSQRLAPIILVCF